MTSFPIRFTPGVRCTHWKDGHTGVVTGFGRAINGRYIVTLEDDAGDPFEAYTPHLTHEHADDRPTIADLERGYANLHAELMAHAATCEGCADQLKSGRPVSCYTGRLLRTDLLDVHCAYTAARDDTLRTPHPASPAQETLWTIPLQCHTDRPITA